MNVSAITSLHRLWRTFQNPNTTPSGGTFSQNANPTRTTMSDQLNDTARAEQQNEPIDLSLFEVAMRFLCTSKGWWMRQILKLLTAPLAAAAAWLKRAIVSGDKTDPRLSLRADHRPLESVCRPPFAPASQYARKAQPIE